MSQNEKELIAKSQAGDRAAFGKLVNSYYEMVYGVAFGVLHLREAALDVCQNVFLKAFQEICRFEGKSKLKTWLYRIAVNAALDEYRRRKPVLPLEVKKDPNEEGTVPVDIPDRRPGPRDDAVRGELQRLVRKAMEGLSEEHRTVLFLREWDDMSYEDIAELLKIEVGTVMSRLFYARKRLGEQLTRAGLWGQSIKGSEKR
ncbi:MAG: RNA polymerase sigma factor [Candidatus Omnitrophota bacterium]